MRTIPQFIRGRRGTVALEFGLATPLLLALVLGTAEIGMVVYEAMQVQDAAEAGAIYASQKATDTAGISAAITSATGTPGISAAPAPAMFCGCPTASGITAGDCAVACPNGNPASRYVLVQTQLTHVPVVQFPGLPNPLVFHGSATVRVQ